jgi:hypothetical protein
VQSGSYDDTFDLTNATTWNPIFLSGPGGGSFDNATAALIQGFVEGRWASRVTRASVHARFPQGTLHSVQREAQKILAISRTLERAS